MRDDRPQARTCAICGKPGGTIPLCAGLRTINLTGNYAHLSCFRKAKRAVEETGASTGGSADA